MSNIPAGAVLERPHTLTIDWFPDTLPPATQQTSVTLRTEDGAATCGVLYRGASTKTVVCLMHPRENFTFHYLIPGLLRAGASVWAQAARSVGNDLRLEHELALHDVAAGLCYLREAGFERIVLLGNSGGSGLYSFYIQQSALPAQDRITKTPGGRATHLASATMPMVDGMIYLAPHPGQGRLLMGCIDPSVTDEGDALSIDDALNPFNPENGYSREQGATRYSAEFVSRYREAQRDRVARLDRMARQLIAVRQDARQAVKDKTATRRQKLVANHTPVMTVWRTDADLRCLDSSLDPSDRKPGSLWSPNPVISNYGSVGFGRLCSPESWLSTWSGLSSNAALEATAPSVTVPSLLVEYTGDQTTFPLAIADISSLIGSTDKTHIRVRGDHHGRPLDDGDEPGRAIAARSVGEWLHQRSFL
ncbi:alpha/beta hydrolase [Paraburkholderia hospita]|uniref:alpha/beta hydrolase n=1 Tax=Paraburkholderia hospita TaxID=169430 RepID=UPI000DEF56A2|nr:alpha/beta hydrolase [Paraburkholderia hospita]AXF06271.1 alpha/beta hydrolase [Paraburkholderia hospita]